MKLIAMILKIASGLFKVSMGRFDGVGKLKGGKFIIGHVKKEVLVEDVRREFSCARKGSSQESEKVFFTLCDKGRLTLDRDGLFDRFQYLLTDWDIANSQRANVSLGFQITYLNEWGEIIDRAKLLEQIIERAIFHILPRLTTNLTTDFILCDRILGFVEKCYCMIMCAECMAAQSLSVHLTKDITETAPRWFFGCSSCAKWNVTGAPLLKTRIFLPLGVDDTRGLVENMFDVIVSHWEIYEEDGEPGGLVFPIFGTDRVLLEDAQEKVKNLLFWKARQKAQELFGPVDLAYLDILDEFNL